MDWKIFWSIVALGLALVAAQGALAYFDGYFSHEQLRKRGIHNMWSFLEHGGMWADVFIITPLIAFATARYRLDLSTWGLGELLASVIITIALIEMYRRGAIAPGGTGDHCTHNGHTVAAGWVHGLFMAAGIWVSLQIFTWVTSPVVSKADIVLFSVLLTPFFYLGVKKFSPLWYMSVQDKWQVVALTAGVWIAAFVRLAHV